MAPKPATTDLNSPGGRIRARRKELGLTMEDLAAQVDVHFTTIAKFERSQRNLSSEMLASIAAALRVAPGELSPGAPLHVPARMVPVLGSVPAGAWRDPYSGASFVDPIGWVPAPYGGASVYALQPEGDSMDLVVGPNATIIVDPDDVELRDGRIYVVTNIKGESTFKRFRVDPPRLEPCSSSPTHKPLPLGKEPLVVNGRVIWQGSGL